MGDLKLETGARPGPETGVKPVEAKEVKRRLVQEWVETRKKAGMEVKVGSPATLVLSDLYTDLSIQWQTRANKDLIRRVTEGKAIADIDVLKRKLQALETVSLIHETDCRTKRFRIPGYGQAEDLDPQPGTLASSLLGAADDPENLQTLSASLAIKEVLDGETGITPKVVMTGAVKERARGR